MTKDLQRRLRSLRSAERELSPDPAWVTKTRESLVLVVKQSIADVPQKQSRGQTWKALWQLVPSQFIQWVRRPVFAGLAAVLGLAGGSLMSVSAAERSLPGDFFYGLKLATEQARLALTSGKDEKLRLKTEFTGRRVDELKQVVDAKQNQHVVEVAEILKRDLDTMKHQLTEVSKEETPAKAADVAKLVDKKTSEVVSALQQTKTQLSPETVEKVTEVQSVAADTGVKAIAVLAEKHEEDKQIVSADEVAQALESHAKLIAEVTPAQPVSVSVVVDMASTSSTVDAATSTLSTLPPTSTLTLIATSAATSTTSTIPLISSTTTLSLPAAVDQLKSATVQAFELQKNKDKQDTAAANASSTPSGTDIQVSTSTKEGTTTSTPSEIPQATSSTTSTTAGNSTAPPKK